MAYQVIARKWRPKNFEELVGQNHVSRTLYNALKSGRLHHALLFTGPRGVGKTSTARILAKSLKCESAKDFQPCNGCRICEEINSGSSVDVIEIDGASHNGVDAIRELRETVAYMPAHGRYKVYIIDEVHMLSVSAFNALLKTLEEPPAHVIFVMATTEPQKIPLTILSRVQRFDLRRIPTKILVEKLKDICEKEGVQFEDEAIWLIARQADGSARDSQSLLDQLITFSNQNITLNNVIEALGLTDRQLILETLEGLIHRSTEKTLQIVEKLYFSGADLKTFSQDLLEELRHLLLIKTSNGNTEIVDIPDSEREILKSFAEHLSAEDIHLLFDMSLKGIQDLQRALDPKLVLEMLLLRMASAPRVQELHQLLTTGAADTPLRGSVRPKQTTAKTNSSQAAPQAPPAKKKVDHALPLTEQWGQVVQWVKQSTPSMGAKLEYLVALEKKENVLSLGVTKDKEFLISQFSSEEARQELGKILENFWGEPLVIECQLFEASQNKHEAALSPREVQQKEAQVKTKKNFEMVENHPMVKEIKGRFQAKVTKITPLKN